MAVERIIGIDFGTSTSVIRVKRYEDGKPVGEKLETKEVNFSDLGTTVPTLIQKKDDDESAVYYGYNAQQKRKKTTTYHSFKVDLESSDPEKRALARKLTEEFFCYLAKTYKAQSEGGYLGDPSDKERTIVSYPVKWSEETRQFMVAAAQKAGFPNVTGMDEAQAAIQAVTVMSEEHLRKNGLLKNDMASNILLIDMGAGTTDLVLCRYTPGEKAKTEIMSTWPKDGDILFGGREVDSLLQNFFRGMMDEETANLVFKRVGLDKFKTWKERTVSPALWKNDSVTDFEPLDNQIEDKNIEIDYCLDRAAFEKCLEEYLKQLPKLINGCIDNSGIKASDVDLVILTGGHSQWYFAQEMLVGKMPQYGKLELAKIMVDPARIVQIARPQETVALGLVYSSCGLKFAERFLALVCRNGKYGYIDPSGSEVIPCQWDDLGYFYEGFAKAKRNEKYGLIDRSGSLTVPCEWDAIHSGFHDGLALVERNGKYGYIDQEGTEVIPCRWDDLDKFHEGFAKAKRNGKHGLIDQSGRLMVPCEWDAVHNSFHDGLALVEKNEKYGYIDQKGTEVIPCRWDKAENFREGLAKVRKNEKYGLIDGSGRLIVPCKWDIINPFFDGLALVKKDEKYGYIDRKGTEVIPCRWDQAEDFRNGLALVKVNTHYGYIDSLGDWVIPCIWDAAERFKEGMAKVRKNEKWGYIDQTGAEIIPCEWEQIGSFCEDLARVRKNEKWGYIDKTGAEIIPCNWDGAEDFCEGFGRVVRNYKVGYIDQFGAEIIPCQWDWTLFPNSFRNGYVVVKKNGLYQYADKNGKLLPFRWAWKNEIQDVAARGMPKIARFFTSKIDKSGNVLADCEWDWVDSFNNGFAKVKKNGKYGFVDPLGIMITPCSWDSAGVFQLVR